MPIDHDPALSPQPTPETGANSLPSPELVSEVSEDLGKKAVGDLVTEPMSEDARIYSRDERAAFHSTDSTIAEVMSRPVEVLPQPEKGQKVLALFDGKVVEAVVDELISPAGTAAYEQIFTVVRTNENGEMAEKTMPIALFKPEIQSDLARRQGLESAAEAASTPSASLTEAMGDTPGKYSELLDPNYEGGSVEAAAVREELDEGDLLARKRAQEDQQNWDANVDQFKRRGF